MTYEEAIAYTKTISRTGSVMGLDSIKSLMHELGDIQDKEKIVHIAGTNGKGSTGTFLCNAWMEMGCRVGRYTSPAVFSPLEVWQINGENITTTDYTSVLSQVKNACDILVSKGMPHPTIFEVETAVAFLYFYQKKCDYVILETGMGGETDATNLILHPLCSVITSVSMDHMQFLGNSLTGIAQAKAGIIKKNCPVVTVGQRPEVMEVIRRKAEEMGAALFIAEAGLAADITDTVSGITYCYDGKYRIETRMAGVNQIENSLLALQVLERVLHVPLEAAARGIKKSVWPGRFEVIGENPLFIIDGAHNEDAAVKLSRTVQNYFTNRRITYIIGVLADKEHGKMLSQMLPFAEQVFTVTPPGPRGLDGRILAEEAARCIVEDAKSCIASDDSSDFGTAASRNRVTCCASVGQAVEAASKAAGAEGIVLAFGSLSYLGEVRQCLCGKEDVCHD